MTLIALILVKVAMATLIASIGIGASLDDVTYLLRRPALLARSLLAMYVLVPLAALLLASILPLAISVKAALLVLAVSAGAPLLPRRLQEFGNNAYGFSLVATTSLLAIVLTPAWVALLARHFGVEAELSWKEVALALGAVFFGPLAAGMTLGHVFPGLSRRFAVRLAALAGFVLIAACLVLMALNWRAFIGVHEPGLIALVTFMAISIAIGHLLGGPDERDRTTLAIACATRHIGIAVVVATAFKGPRTIVILAAYVIASAIVSIPYLRWRRRSAQAARPSPSA